MVWEMLSERVTMACPNPVLHDEHVIAGKRMVSYLMCDWVNGKIDDPSIIPSPMWATPASLSYSEDNFSNVLGLLRKAIPVLDIHYRKHTRVIS